MTEQFNAKVHVVKTGNEGEIASAAPENFQKEDVDRIAHITNLIVVNLQNDLAFNKEKAPGSLDLSELELTFGIDIGIEAKTGVKFPIIGPLFSVGAKAGATFQVHVKLTRNNSQP